MGASSTPHREAKAKAPPVDLHPKEIKTLAPRIEVVGPLGGIEFCLLGGEEAVEDMPLILIGDPHARILDPKKDLLPPLFRYHPYRSPIGRILDGVLQKALHDLPQDPLIRKYAEVLFPFHEKTNIPMVSFPSHLPKNLFDEGKQADGLSSGGPLR